LFHDFATTKHGIETQSISTASSAAPCAAAGVAWRDRSKKTTRTAKSGVYWHHHHPEAATDRADDDRVPPDLDAFGGRPPTPCANQNLVT
jgi:hypothetical protein